MDNIHEAAPLYYLVDTNEWVSNLDRLKAYDNLVVLGSVLRELDKLKGSPNNELAYRSRCATRYIKENRHRFKFDMVDYNAEIILGTTFENSYVDNQIVACLMENRNYQLVTSDVLLLLKAQGFGLSVIELDERIVVEEEHYKGFIEASMSEQDYRDFHDNRLDQNEFNCLVNQYLIVNDAVTGKPIQSFKWDGSYYVHIKKKKLKSRNVGEFDAWDEYQSCAIDSVLSNQFTMFRGKAGTAKTQITVAYALQQLQTSKHDKLIIFSNALPTYGAHYHGMVKGDLKTKLMDSSIGNILASKLGSYDQVEAMMLTEELWLLPASDIRGFDSSGMNAVIAIIEAQNYTPELLKLAIQRTGSDCKLIIEGDNSTQLDGVQFEGVNNGMRRASQVFRGQPYYGEIELQNIYRSEIAARAELMTEMKF